MIKILTYIAFNPGPPEGYHHKTVALNLVVGMGLEPMLTAHLAFELIRLVVLPITLTHQWCADNPTFHVSALFRLIYAQAQSESHFNTINWRLAYTTFGKSVCFTVVNRIFIGWLVSLVRGQPATPTQLFVIVQYLLYYQTFFNLSSLLLIYSKNQ